MMQKRYCYNCRHWVRLSDGRGTCGNEDVSPQDYGDFRKKGILEHGVSVRDSGIYAANFCHKFEKGGVA